VGQDLAHRIGAAKVLDIEQAQAREMTRLLLTFALPALILLNTRNAVRTTETPASAKLNRARRARGKPPLCTYHSVTIHLDATGHGEGPDGTGSRRAAAATLVAGHFKVRKSGIFWWSPHARSGRTGTPSGPKIHKVTR